MLLKLGISAEAWASARAVWFSSWFNWSIPWWGFARLCLFQGARAHFMAVTWVCGGFSACGCGRGVWSVWLSGESRKADKTTIFFSHKKANKSSQKPSPSKLRRERQLLQGCQQVSPYPEAGCASRGLHLLPQAAPGGSHKGPKSENQVRIPRDKRRNDESCCSLFLISSGWHNPAGQHLMAGMLFSPFPSLSPLSSQAVSCSEEEIQANLYQLPFFCRQEEMNVHLERHQHGLQHMNSLPNAPLNSFLLHLFVFQIKLHSSVWRKV